MTRLTTTLVVILLAIGMTACEEQVTQPVDRAELSSSAAEAPEVELGKAGRPLNFVASLSGNHEVPPVETDGTGLAKFRATDGGNELAFKLIAANIDGVTQAHIHCGGPGVNGPVVAFLFGFVGGGVSPSGILSQGTVTDADVISRPDSEVCPGGVANFDDLIARMQEGGTYVNVHTIANPPGEIRGQIDRGNGVKR